MVGICKLMEQIVLKKFRHPKNNIKMAPPVNTSLLLLDARMRRTLASKFSKHLFWSLHPYDRLVGVAVAAVQDSSEKQRQMHWQPWALT